MVVISAKNPVSLLVMVLLLANTEGQISGGAIGQPSSSNSLGLDPAFINDPFYNPSSFSGLTSYPDPGQAPSQQPNSAINTLIKAPTTPPPAPSNLHNLFAGLGYTNPQPKAPPNSYFNNNQYGLPANAPPVNILPPTTPPPAPSNLHNLFAGLGFTNPQPKAPPKSYFHSQQYGIQTTPPPANTPQPIYPHLPNVPTAGSTQLSRGGLLEYMTEDPAKRRGNGGPVFNSVVFARQEEPAAVPFTRTWASGSGVSFGSGRLYSMPIGADGRGLLESVASPYRRIQRQQQQQQQPFGFFGNMGLNPWLFALALSGF